MTTEQEQTLQRLYEIRGRLDTYKDHIPLYKELNDLLPAVPCLPDFFSNKPAEFTQGPSPTNWLYRANFIKPSGHRWDKADDVSYLPRRLWKDQHQFGRVNRPYTAVFYASLNPIAACTETYTNGPNLEQVRAQEKAEAIVGSPIYFKWYLDDVSGGSGERDAIALDHIEIVPMTANPTGFVDVELRVMLEGASPLSGGLMRDDLRVQALIPQQEPYSSLGYAHHGGGAETTSPAVLAVSGAAAIVDWVVVELRDAVNPSIIRATRSALLQRDGDVVGMNGVSPLWFEASDASYYVSVRHRNHLGAMSTTPITIVGGTIALDLSNLGTPTYGINARKVIGGSAFLYSGDVTFDSQLKYTGTANDRDVILQAIGGTIPTATIHGYRQEDTNLDGVVKYTGTANDRDIILVNIGGSIPTNTLNAQLP